MWLKEFHTQQDQFKQVSAEQASRFAKQIAGDFNPIHDVDSKRFCVPGDLLFALTLNHYGLSQNMKFDFLGMVGADTALNFADTDAAGFDIADSNGKTCLHVERSGDISRNAAAIESLTRDYVAFSGTNFPHVLQPLLAEQQVMFNPARPLVIYESMEFSLQTLDFADLQLEAADASLQVNGKRGDVTLAFRFNADGREIGKGSKKLVVSSLRPYDEQAMQQIVADYQRAAAGG